MCGSVRTTTICTQECIFYRDILLRAPERETKFHWDWMTNGVSSGKMDVKWTVQHLWSVRVSGKSSGALDLCWCSSFSLRCINRPPVCSITRKMAHTGQRLWIHSLLRIYPARKSLTTSLDWQITNKLESWHGEVPSCKNLFLIQHCETSPETIKGGFSSINMNRGEHFSLIYIWSKRAAMPQGSVQRLLKVHV